MDINTSNYFEPLAKYNTWMNRKLYTLCDALDDETRKRDRGSFFGSIHRTLDHILFGDIAWLERLRDKSFTPRNINQEIYKDWNELKTERYKLDKEIERWVQTFNEEMLDEIITFTSNVDKKQRDIPMRILVQHLFNHQTHHRGQLTTLLSQLNIDYGSTDLPFLPDLNN